MKYLSDHYKEKFGCKVYKLSLDGGFSCPNRDGTLGTGGCIFCTGSGEFAEGGPEPVSVQLERAKRRVAAKNKGGKYMAYFQAFTNTYAPVEKLRSLYSEAISPEDVVGLSVGTRPDCLGDDVVALLAEMNRVKPVSVELGLQTVHEQTAHYIRRGYPAETYFDAVKRLKAVGIEVVTHIILGLPGETLEMMLRTTRAAVLKQCIALLPEHIVIHRITGDGAKKDLIAPMWSADKKRVLNYLHRVLE